MKLTWVIWGYWKPPIQQTVHYLISKELFRQFPVVDILGEVAKATVHQLPGAAVNRESLGDLARLHHV